jgi:hypothetical protein
MWLDAARRPEKDVNKWVCPLNWIRSRCVDANFGNEVAQGTDAMVPIE